MDPELSKEWLALQFAMRDRLRMHAYVNSGGYTALLQFAVFPSFENSWSWDIFRQVRGDDVAVWKTIWRFDRDVDAFSSPVERQKHPRPFKPTVKVFRLDVSPASAVQIVEEFYDLSIPIHAPDSSMGLDGTSYELQIGAPFCACRFKWWERVPRSWNVLEPRIANLKHLLQGAPELSSGKPVE
jgi:hypothetical protein